MPPLSPDTLHRLAEFLGHHHGDGLWRAAAAQAPTGGPVTLAVDPTELASAVPAAVQLLLCDPVAAAPAFTAAAHRMLAVVPPPPDIARFAQPPAAAPPSPPLHLTIGPVPAFTPLTMPGFPDPCGGGAATLLTALLRGRGAVPQWLEVRGTVIATDSTAITRGGFSRLPTLRLRPVRCASPAWVDPVAVRLSPCLEAPRLGDAVVVVGYPGEAPGSCQVELVATSVVPVRLPLAAPVPDPFLATDDTPHSLQQAFLAARTRWLALAEPWLAAPPGAVRDAGALLVAHSDATTLMALPLPALLAAALTALSATVPEAALQTIVHTRPGTAAALAHRLELLLGPGGVVRCAPGVSMGPVVDRVGTVETARAGQVAAAAGRLLVVAAGEQLRPKELQALCAVARHAAADFAADGSADVNVTCQTSVLGFCADTAKVTPHIAGWVRQADLCLLAPPPPDLTAEAALLEDLTAQALSSGDITAAVTECEVGSEARAQLISALRDGPAVLPRPTRSASELLEQFFAFCRRGAAPAPASLASAAVRIAGLHASLCGRLAASVVDAAVSVALCDASMRATTGVSVLPVSLFDQCCRPGFSVAEHIAYVTLALR